ncbi:hypothetical protein [Thiomicrorhabdus aquaedulcis]|uniref:hypothetical protein n=1 Tax=Thiomicrorhabdus aquaedulcis TaxID=2211106 RepID=UPI001E5E9169|nr:hypothetical protein [Thiomicrorhabdus aquaedulcis]
MENDAYSNPNVNLNSVNLSEDDTFELIPSAEEMLQRLHAVDATTLDISRVAQQLKGDKIWISIFTIPISAIVLVLLTLLGTFMFDQFVASFLISAALLFWIAKMLDQYDKQFSVKARQVVIERIAQIEGEFGLIPHFKHFLPAKYRHLWQSVRKGNYVYIDQYIQALVLLQHKLDPKKFTKIWYLTYPDIAPEELDNS